jgi:hypothetical protein
MLSIPDNRFRYRIAHPHGYSEKSLSRKGKRQVLHPSGSVPWVERVATERQAVGVVGGRSGGRVVQY